jgi:integrating conjugative element protein (TIGR03755 family)
VRDPIVSYPLPRPCVRLALVLVLAGATPAAAAPAPTGASRWYYHIGGAEAVMAPLNGSVRTATLSGSLNLGLGLNCHGFDPVAGLTTAVGQVVDNLEAVVTQAAASAVASLPALILQRANPSLYELYQEVVSYANGAVSLATKSCEQMQTDIAHGNNPFDHWLTLSKSYTWKNQAGEAEAGSDSVDVMSALGVVESTGDKAGTPWVGGQKAGGDPAQMAPIRVVSDVVAAGYNIELNRGVLDTSAASPGQQTETRLAQIWKTPAEAAAFAVDVLGDIKVQSGGPAATPGHGLGPRIEAERTRMNTALADLVSGATPPTPDNLAAVSAPGTRLTREVLDALRKLPSEDRPVAIAKLAGEAATAVEVEKALMVRRLLLAGAQEPQIYASPAGEDIQRLVGVIDREIDQLLYETRIRRELFAGTAGAFLDLGRGLDTRGVPLYRPGDAKPVENSGVKP